MKNLFFLCFPILVLLFVSCDKEDPVAVGGNLSVADITLLAPSASNVPIEISVTIHKPTPCHSVKEVNKTVSGKIFNYDFILQDSGEMCVQVIANETVNVSFDPSESGEYILNFFINGTLIKTSSVTVS